MANAVQTFWKQLERREQLILIWGSVAVVAILFYSLIWQPWHKAIAHMESAIQPTRTNLVWMKQQAELVKNGAANVVSNTKGRNQSLLSVIEQTAKAANVRKAIQQMVPGQSSSEVRVVLEEANFNQWVQWVDVLFKQYSVQIKQVTAEREDGAPNIAEIRVTFERT